MVEKYLKFRIFTSEKGQSLGLTTFGSSMFVNNSGMSNAHKRFSRWGNFKTCSLHFRDMLHPKLYWQIGKSFHVTLAEKYFVDPCWVHVHYVHWLRASVTFVYKEVLQIEICRIFSAYITFLAFTAYSSRTCLPHRMSCHSHISSFTSPRPLDSLSRELGLLSLLFYALKVKRPSF